MNPITIALITIRGAALALLVAGDQKTSNALYLVADAIESGRATDEHMQVVAEKLKERDLTQVDWDDVLQRIQTDHDRLHAPDTPSG